MINIRELRLGNLLCCNEHIFTVTSVSSNSIGASTETGGPDCDQLNFQYIALDAAWMSRFSGNEKGYMIISELERQTPGSEITVLSTIECFLHKDGFLRVCAYEYERYPDGSAEIPDDVITLGYDHIRYVHQLQNLYHTLTGKELAPPKR